MTKTELQGQLAELIDERLLRTAAFEAAQRAKADAEARLSQLRGQMALDGTNLAKRIATAQQEAIAADVTIKLWPDVQAELERRIAATQDAIQAATVAETRTELQSIMDSERGRRLAFAEALHTFAQVGADLRAMLQRKQALKMQLYATGAIVEVGSDQLDAWPVWGVGEPATIDEARRLIDLYR